MLVLGCSGGLDHAGETWFAGSWRRFHDSAAVLVEDGRVVAAAEQERFDRLKHSNKFPGDAIRWCLAQRGVALDAVAVVAYYADAEALDGYRVRRPPEEGAAGASVSTRRLLIERFREQFDLDVSGRLLPVPHHDAHALSAYLPSGFAESLVVTLDGGGDGLSGAVFDGSGATLTRWASFPLARTLGGLYLSVTRHLGFDLFDEYKVMGLAAHGDPAPFRPLFARVCLPLEDGGYDIDFAALSELADFLPERTAGEPLTRAHAHVAAALQEALERTVLHLLGAQQRRTGRRNLCLAGGVAQNSSLNGRILRSGLFERVFVQPAAHDAGCALGAALAPFLGGPHGAARMEHAFLGVDIGGAARVRGALRGWEDLVSVENAPEVAATTAHLLAGGAIVAWVQGRAEFGPRALGNRSILADPRSPAAGERINAAIKRREPFRPFAAAVLEERAAEFFDLPPGGQRLPFMSFVVPVRPEKRALLAAVTHADGSARIQTVSRHNNPRFWEVIRAFERLTGVPVLLNTSLNNDAEPIVNGVDDAVVCLLTSGLDALVAGDSLVRRRTGDTAAGIGGLVPSLPAHVAVVRTDRAGAAPRFTIQDTYRGRQAALSPLLHAILIRADGRRSLARLLADERVTDAAVRATVTDEIQRLWRRRLLRLLPPDRAPEEEWAVPARAAAPEGQA